MNILIRHSEGVVEDPVIEAGMMGRDENAAVIDAARHVRVRDSDPLALLQLQAASRTKYVRESKSNCENDSPKIWNGWAQSTHLALLLRRLARRGAGRGVALPSGRGVAKTGRRKVKIDLLRRLSGFAVGVRIRALERAHETLRRTNRRREDAVR